MLNAYYITAALNQFFIYNDLSAMYLFLVFIVNKCILIRNVICICVKFSSVML